MSENLRRVTVESCPTYNTDNGVGSYVFTVNGICNGIDLSSLTAYLKIRFQDESTDKILLSDVTKKEDDLIINFVVSDAFSRVAGKASCQLSFENVDGSVIVNTEVFTVEILDSIEVESYGQTILPSAIRLLQTKLGEQIAEMNEKINSLNKSVFLTQVFVSANNFSQNEQTLYLEGVKENSVVTFSPADNHSVVNTAGVYISGQYSDAVTLTCAQKPTGDFTLNFFVANAVEELTT